MRRSVPMLVLCAACALPAAAWEKGPVAMPGNPNQTCAMQETGQVGVSFNNVMLTKLDKIGTEMDAKIDEVMDLAKQAGLAKVEVQSYNYNVYPVSSGMPFAPGVNVPYQYTGSVSLSVEPCAKASALMSLLAAKGYAANLNINAYRQCQ